MLIMVTGPMAAGKSTVAQALAEGFARSVHLRGDVYRRMVVSGRVDMGSAPSDEARLQLALRYKLAHDAARMYLQAGFTVVYQDTIVGPVLSDVLRMYHGVSVHLVVLSPSEDAIRRREEARSKKGYHRISIEELYTALGQTPRVGLWIDNSEQSVEQTVRHILDNLPAARVGAGI